MGKIHLKHQPKGTIVAQQGVILHVMSSSESLAVEPSSKSLEFARMVSIENALFTVQSGPMAKRVATK